MLSVNELQSAFEYEPWTGVLRWKRRAANRVRVGAIAGCPKSDYWQVCLNNQRMLAHRVAWAIHYGNWPQGEIDHINGDGLDNRIDNLRVTDHFGNMRNSKRMACNTSGVKGVSWRSDSRRWRVTIRAGGRRLNLGSFKSIAEAAAVVAAARADHHGEFARYA